MKAIVTGLLCLGLLMPVMAEPPKKNGLTEAMLIIGFMVAASSLIFYIYVKDGRMTDPVNLVLEESGSGLPERAGGIWTPIKTNYNVVLDGRKLVQCFDPVLMRDENHFYRVRIIP